MLRVWQTVSEFIQKNSQFFVPIPKHAPASTSAIDVKPCCFSTQSLCSLLIWLDPWQTSGRITYNGHTFDEFIPQRTSSYISQTDNHIGELTVRETLDFAVRCQGVGYKQGLFSLPILPIFTRDEPLRPESLLRIIRKVVSMIRIIWKTMSLGSLRRH